MTSRQAVLESLEQMKRLTESEDTARIRSAWLQSIKDLFVKFEGWLQTARDRDLLQVRRGEVALSEERLGDYSAPGLTIAIPGGLTISIVPRARFVAGASGRVDFHFPPREAALLQRTNGDWEFAILDDRLGYRMVPLNEESFWMTIGKLIGRESAW